MNSNSRKRRRGSDGWERHRPEIERLYLTLDLPLKEVMEEMKKPPHNFDKTEQAYKKRLGHWDISKNVPASVISEMLAIADRRHRDHGKETEFYWHGAKVEQDKIRRTQKRLMKGANATPASTASLKNMRYCTPSPVSIQNHVSDAPKAAPAPCEQDEQALDGSLDVVGTWKSLRDITATLQATPDNARVENLEPIMAAQERLLAGYLFFFGKDNTAYLSHCLSLCYISVHTGTCADYTTLFKRASPRASELEWPGSNVNTLLRLAIAFMGLDTTCEAALDLLEFAMDHPTVNVEDWKVPTRIRIVERSQDIKAYSIAGRHISLAIEDMLVHPDSWDEDDRASLIQRLRMQDWEESSILTLKSERVQDVEKFFLLARLLLDAGSYPQALKMVGSAASAKLEDFRAHTAIIKGVLAIWDTLDNAPELTPGLNPESFFKSAERFLEPHGHDYVEAQNTLEQLRNRLRDRLPHARPSLTVNVPAARSAPGSNNQQTLQFCHVASCPRGMDPFTTRRDLVHHQLKDHGILEGTLTVPSLDGAISPREAMPHSAPDTIATNPATTSPQPAPSLIKRQPKWTAEEDALIIELRGNGMKWEDIAKRLPARSPISCRLRYQNFLERKNSAPSEPVALSNERGRTTERFQASDRYGRSPTSVHAMDLATKHYSPPGTISPSILSRDASPSQPPFAQESPDSRRASQVSMTSALNERLRLANEARSSVILTSTNDPLSVPNSPFRPTSAYASEWRANSDAQYTRRSSAPGLDWSTGSVGASGVHGVHFTNPNPFASQPRNIAQDLFTDFAFPDSSGPLHPQYGFDHFSFPPDTHGTASTDLQHPPRPPESTNLSPYACTYHGCDAHFETPIQLQRHKREDHRLVNPGYVEQSAQRSLHQCEHIYPTTGKRCNTFFSQRNELHRHQKTVHNIPIPKVSCTLCLEKTFSRADALERHYKVVHPDQPLPRRGVDAVPP